MSKEWEEHIAIPVSDKENLTPFVFFDYLLPELRKCLLENQNSLISLDMTEVKSVSPLVLPNLLIVGKILQIHFGEPIKIILGSRNSDMIRFLYDMAFFRLIDKHEFFAYDKDFVGGFSSEKTGDYGVLLYLPISEDPSPEQIARQLLRNNRDIKAFLGHFDDEDLADTFVRAVGELSHNCMKHGHSFAVLSAYGGPKIGLHCAVSDCGVGYRESLLEKPEDLVVYSEADLRFDDMHCHYKAIIEAVCKRFEKETYGLSSVIRDIAKIGGTTRVHSVNTQVVFTARNQSQFMNTCEPEQTGSKLAESLLRLAARADSIQSSPVRIRESKLAGVHVEFEIPPVQKQMGGT